MRYRQVLNGACVRSSYYDKLDVTATNLLYITILIAIVFDFTQTFVPGNRVSTLGFDRTKENKHGSNQLNPSNVNTIVSVQLKAACISYYGPFAGKASI